MGKLPIIPTSTRLVEQADVLQHNGMTNYEKEMCMWKDEVLLGALGSGLP